MTKKLLILTIAALAVSCSSAPKKRDLPKSVPVAGAWSGQSAAGMAADSSWWAEFNDPGLNRIIGEAFSNNHTLQMAAANLQAAAAQAKIAGAPLAPQLSGSFSSSKRKQNFIGLPIPGAEGKVLSNTSTTYGVSLNLNWEFDLWGKLRADQAAALANLQATQADYIGAGLSLTGQVAKAWFAAIEAKRQVELSEATVQSMQSSTDQVRRRYERGLTSSLDLRMSLANLAAAEAALKARQAAFEQIVRQLEILLGRYPSAELKPESGLPVIRKNVPAGLPADLLMRRPDLIAAERRLAASDAAVSSAKRALLPSISLTASTGTSTKELKDLTNGDFSVWSLAGNLLQPIFQRGRLLANIKLAKSNSSAALQLYAQTALGAFTEVENALANENYLRDREEALKQAAEQSDAALTLAQERYNRGLINYISLLETQRSAYSNESQLLSIQRERLDARIDLHLALGGGFVQVKDKHNIHGE